MNNKYNVRYKMIKTTELVDDIGLVTAYGVCCRDERPERKRQRARYQMITNISTKKSFVAKLVYMLREYEADPIHLQDLIEDYLLSHETGGAIYL